MISAINSSTIQNSHFSSRRKTSFIIHGFGSTGKSGWVVEMCLVWDYILCFPSAVVTTFCSYNLDTKVHLLFCNALNSFRYQPRNYQPKLKYSHSARCCVVTASCSTLTLCFSRKFSSPKPYKADQSNKLNTDVPSLYTDVRISEYQIRPTHCFSHQELLNHPSAEGFPE